MGLTNKMELAVPVNIRFLCAIDYNPETWRAGERKRTRYVWINNKKLPDYPCLWSIKKAFGVLNILYKLQEIYVRYGSRDVEYYLALLEDSKWNKLGKVFYSTLYDIYSQGYKLKNVSFDEENEPVREVIRIFIPGDGGDFDWVCGDVGDWDGWKYDEIGHYGTWYVEKK